MFALPTWLAIYLSIGLSIQLLALSRPTRLDPPSTWLGCAVAVVAFALLWPVFLAVAVKRVRRG